MGDLPRVLYNGVEYKTVFQNGPQGLKKLIKIRVAGRFKPCLALKLKGAGLLQSRCLVPMSTFRSHYDGNHSLGQWLHCERGRGRSSTCFSTDSPFSGTPTLCSKVSRNLKGGLAAKLEEGGPSCGFAWWKRPPSSLPSSEIMLNFRTCVPLVSVKVMILQSCHKGPSGRAQVSLE